MSKLLAAVVAAMFALGSVSGFAADDMKKDGAKKEMKKADKAKKPAKPKKEMKKADKK